VAAQASDFNIEQQPSTNDVQQVQYQSVGALKFQQNSISAGIWFGTRGSEVQILSHRPIISYTYTLSLFEPIRANCWWEHKLSPVLATIYATAALSRISFPSLWPVVALALLALIVCASYVSVLNDLTDAEDDQASGKPSRWPGQSRIYPALLLAACLAAGCSFLLLWRKDKYVFSAYLLCWLAFTLYSARPFRLKVRGVWGVLADASGAHLFPTLFAVFLLYHWTRAEQTAAWVLVIALWSFAAGVRGILWHQLEDAVSDRKIGLRTFACLHGTKAAERLALLALLLESAAFMAMLG